MLRSRQIGRVLLVAVEAPPFLAARGLLCCTYRTLLVCCFFYLASSAGLATALTLSQAP